MPANPFTLGEDFDLGSSYLGGNAPPAVYDARAATLFVAEIDAYDPATRITSVLRASDLGYRTAPSDPMGVVAYPGVLDQAFEIDRRVSLDPAGTNTATFGAIRLVNLGGRFDAFVQSCNIGGRNLRLKIGQKGYDPGRGIYTDPSYDDLRPFLFCTSGPVLLGEDVLTIPINDLTHLGDKPLQSRRYGGTGRLDGTSDLAGKPKPMTRGGTAALPVSNVPLRLVDPVANIWAWTDGPGAVVALYEGGAPVFAPAGDVADLYAGTTPPGAFRTCNALGVLQLGSKPVRALSADVTGTGPATAVALARSVLLSDLACNADLLDGGTFTLADRAYPWLAGFHVADGSARGLDVVQRLLGSVGGRLLSGRDGYLGAFVLAPPLPDAAPAARLGPHNVVSVTPIALPPTLDPPPRRWQVGWGVNNQMQASDFNGDLTPERKQFLAAASRYATWDGPDVAAAWGQAGEPAPLETYLLANPDAQALADWLGALWQDRPDCYAVTVPITVGAGFTIGDAPELTWPLGLLRLGRVGVIFGEQTRSYDGTVTFAVAMLAPTILPVDFFAGDFGSEFLGGAA